MKVSIWWIAFEQIKPQIKIQSKKKKNNFIYIYKPRTPRKPEDFW